MSFLFLLFSWAHFALVCTPWFWPKKETRVLPGLLFPDELFSTRKSSWGGREEERKGRSGGGEGGGGDRRERERGQMSGKERGKGQGVRDRRVRTAAVGRKSCPLKPEEGRGQGWETGRRVERRGEKGVYGEARPGGQSWSSFLLGPRPSQLLEHLHPGGGVSKWSCLFLDFLPSSLGPAPLGPSQRACGSSYLLASRVQTAKSALKVGEQLGKNGVRQGKQCLILDITTPGAGAAPVRP